MGCVGLRCVTLGCVGLSWVALGCGGFFGWKLNLVLLPEFAPNFDASWCHIQLLSQKHTHNTYKTKLPNNIPRTPPSPQRAIIPLVVAARVHSVNLGAHRTTPPKHRPCRIVLGVLGRQRSWDRDLQVRANWRRLRCPIQRAARRALAAVFSSLQQRYIARRRLQTYMRALVPDSALKHQV